MIDKIRDYVKKYCNFYKNGTCSASLMCEFSDGGRMECCHFLNHVLPRALMGKTEAENTPIPFKWQNLDRQDIVIFDTETTGLNPQNDRIVEICLIKYGTRRIEKGKLEIFLKSDIPLGEEAARITGLTQQEIDDGGSSVEPSLKAIAGFIGHADTILIAHNSSFDISFLNESFRRVNMPLLCNPVRDTFEMAANLYPFANCHLVPLARHLGIDIEKFTAEIASANNNGSTSRAHRAAYDARLTAKVFFIMEQEYLERGKK